MRKLKKYKPTKFMAKTSHYDKDAADYAVMFIESLCHTKGTWAGKPFELIDWQAATSNTIFAWLRSAAQPYTSARSSPSPQRSRSATAAASSDLPCFLGISIYAVLN